MEDLFDWGSTATDPGDGEPIEEKERAKQGVAKLELSPTFTGIATC